jgi:hypothetical protein
MKHFRINVTKSHSKRSMNLHFFGLTPSYPPLPRERGRLKPLSPGRGVWGEANKFSKTVT